MRLVVQRVRQAEVLVEGEVTGAIGPGLLVLLGVSPADTPGVALKLVTKLLALRIFEDADGKMNLDVRQAGGSVLCVSQFTLYADVRRGNRPSFTGAAPPAHAEALYEEFCMLVRAAEVVCETGRFGADMQVSLTNDGPVTIILDSDDLARPRDSWRHLDPPPARPDN